MIDNMLRVAAVSAVVVLGSAGCHSSQASKAFETRSSQPVALSVVGRPKADARLANPIMPLASANGRDLSGKAGNAQTRPLSVLTFNMEHRDRPEHLDIMARQLRSELSRTPDFILLQEVLFERSNRNGQGSTAAVLADELGYHSIGTKRSSDREGIAIASRYPFAYYEERELESQTSRFLLGFNRVSIMGEFIVPDIGRVRVVNVHFTNWGFEKRVRRNQLKETLRWIAARQKAFPTVMTILGGDFNFEPNDSEADLLSDMSVTGGMMYHDWNGDEPTRGNPGNPTKRIDYIFVSSPKRAIRMVGEQLLFQDGLKAKKGGRFFLSDHVPVLHEYNVRSSGAAALAKGSKEVDRVSKADFSRSSAGAH